MSCDMNFYIIIPIYKSQEYLCECLDSVIAQSYGNFRAVCVDDGSPDKCGEICDAYEKKDGRIISIHKENGGQISARCAGIDCVKKNFNTENAFYIFLDSDDTLEPNTLKTIKDTALRTNADLIFYDMNRIINGKIITNDKGTFGYCRIVSDKKQLYKTVFSNSKYNSLPTKAIRCDIMPEIDLSEFHYLRRSEDLLQSIYIYKNAKNAAFINDRLYNYRSNPSSVTHSISYNNYKTDSSVREKVLEFLKEEAVFSEKDLNEYLSYCSSLLRNEILTIINFDTQHENKKELLSKLSENPYYNMLLKTNSKSDLILFLTRTKNYRFLICKAALRKKLTKIYHKIKPKNTK